MDKKERKKILCIDSWKFTNREEEEEDNKERKKIGQKNRFKNF